MTFGTDLARGTNVITISAVLSICLCVHTIAITIHETLLTGKLTLSFGADFTGFTKTVAVAAVSMIYLGIYTVTITICEAFLA